MFTFPSWENDRNQFALVFVQSGWLNHLRLFFWGDLFMDSTMVNHHYSPPFWENMFLWRAPYLGGFSMIFETDGWKNVPRILNILKEVETTKYQYQVAQAVTFLSPNLWGHFSNLWFRGSRFHSLIIPKQKGHVFAELPGGTVDGRNPAPPGMYKTM